jgi:GNAT superfamily N-acetyltransferase
MRERVHIAGVTDLIRRARVADAPALTRIAHAAKRHWRYPDAWIRLWDADLTVTPGFVRRHPTWCAVRGGRVVGFWAVSGRGATRELEHMWVDPRHIGAGIGRALLAHCEDRLRRMAVTRLEIASDPNAEGFYRRLGARRIGEVPARPDGRTLPLLALTISASAARCSRDRPRATAARATSPRAPAGRPSGRSRAGRGR